MKVAVFSTVILLAVFSYSYGGGFYECVRNAISIQKAVTIAKVHTGKPYKVWVSKSKRTGECFWKIKGTRGYMVLRADDGEIIKFYRNKR